ncbi:MULTISPECIES: hypothetical protein [Streptomyces]|uniref:hypothetical protein n=1 Tax=Streptomyces TaxID=1883 RepID=UPI001E3F791C|nr:MULTISPECIES: hypothetical protein [Streptomyces]UFQ18918.1 hypothetical protein J2N69_30255 [Streptomyces huasconensis]WCL88537.1 hypothetical protein PPN52_30220 [Streptomyces sp. JCM 35825]
MPEFLEAATGFPAVIFSSALVVVLGFWLLVVLGGAEAGSFDSDADLGMVGLGGVPVTVVVSMTVVVAWFSAFAGSVLIGRAELTGLARAAAGLVLLLLSLPVAWGVARVLVRPLAKLFPDEPGPSRQDFIGSVCTIRTGWVDAGFGQAEVASKDGAVALVQVRQNPQARESVLTAGCSALLYAYDDTGEFFWATPYAASLDPGHPRAGR